MESVERILQDGGLGLRGVEGRRSLGWTGEPDHELRGIKPNIAAKARSEKNYFT